MKEKEKEKDMEIISISISEIKFKKRLREDMGDLEDLKESIRTKGQLNPVVVSEEYYLIAGQRRYEAMKQLKLETIEVKVIKGIGEYESLMIEIEENSTRKEFTYQEMRKAIEKKKMLEIKNNNILLYWFRRLKKYFLSVFKK